MTLNALAYLILGILTMTFPILTILLRRHILSAQWILIFAQLMLGISFILHGCLFNTFLTGEYLLVVLYMLFALSTPPVCIIAIAMLTRPDGLTRVARMAFIPPIIVVVAMAASILIGGVDMYRLWIFRGSLGEADVFYAHSWRYNLIVSIHMYAFTAITALQAVFVGIYAIVHLRRYHRTLSEYYTPDRQSLIRNHHTIYLLIVIICVSIIFSIIRFPLNMPRPEMLTIVVCAIAAVAAIVLGYFIHNISYDAETLSEELAQSHLRVRKDLAQLGTEISNFVEHSAYLDPDLSVFLLASHFHVSQDQVVDAIHRLHGTSFADYIDGLRVQHATALMPNVANTDDPETLRRIAHQCGYLTVEDLEYAFEKVMHTSIHKSGLL